MNTPSDTYVLAGRNRDGAWHQIEAASVEEGETAEDLRTFLQTMALASTHNYLELEIMTAAEFAQCTGRPPRGIAA